MVSPLTLYGAKERAQTHKQQEQRIADDIRAAMPRLIQEQLPALATPPVIPADYESQTPLFLIHLRTHFRDLKRLRLALEYLASFIEQGNQDGRWALKVPPRLLSVPRSRVTRTRSLFRQGAEVAMIYQDWRHALATRSAPKQSSNQDCLADVLISAMVHGGLVNQHAVVALANQLQTRQPVHKLADRVWVDLIWEPKQGAENHPVTDEQGEIRWQSLQRFYLDTFTLGLTHRYLQKKEIQTKPFDEATLWKLIHARLTDMTEHDHLTTVDTLSSFCQGAMSVTEMLDGVELPQALMECARGGITACSLRPDDHLRWLRNTPMAVNGSGSSAPLRFLERQLDNSLGYDNQTAARIGTTDARINKVRYALRPNEQTRKRTTRMAIADIEMLVDEADSSAMNVLIGWLLESLTRLTLSSARRYFMAVKSPWLFFMHGQELEDLSETEWEIRYDDMLSQRSTPKAREYLKGRLAQLHQYVGRQLDVPSLSTFFDSTATSSKRIRVRTGMIPEAVFQALLQRLTAVQNLDEATIEGLRHLLVLAYRTGLRRDELLALRLSDVENSDQLWLFVRDHQKGHYRQSTSNFRKLPAQALLLTSEFNQLWHYIGQRRARYPNRLDALLFSTSSSETTPLNTRAVNELVKQLLVEQGMDGLTFHHLRHSALTNLMLVLDEDDALIDRLSPYSVEQARYLRKFLFSVRTDNQRDRYWTLAGVAGHLTPEITFSHCVHCTDLLMHQRLGKFSPMMDVTEAYSVTGIPIRTLNLLARESADSAVTTDQSNAARYSLSSLQADILARFERHCVNHGANDASATLLSETTTPTTRTETKGTQTPQTTKRTISIQDCYIALRDLEAGDSVAVVATRYHLKEQSLENWLESALTLQQQHTQQGNSRLFSRTRKPSHYGLPLLPAKPNDHAITVDIDHYVTGLRRVFKQDKPGLLWAINYWLNSTHTSGSGLRFNQPETVTQFLTPIRSAVPIKHWRLVVNTPKTASSDALKAWKQCVPRCEIVHDNRTGSPFAKLYLTHPNEPAIIKNRHGGYHNYSSSLLRYVFHMLAIMVGLPESGSDKE